MSRNRRNKRTSKVILNEINTKQYIILASILIIIIISCVLIINYRNKQENLLLSKQRQELEKNIEAIYEETNQNINNINNTTRNSIIRISAIGDILCENDMLQDAYEKNTQNYQFNKMFKNISTYLTNSDITIGTMETNFTNNEYSGYGLRNSPLAFAQAIKDIGVNLVSISTNHSLDYGTSGIQTTKRNLETLGFDVVGDNLSANRVVIKNIKGKKIAFLSYTYGVENQNKKTKEELESINIYSNKIAKQDLKYASENADFNIIIMHWGDAYSTSPNNEQQNIAKFLVENGANMILGNHASAVQKMEIMQNNNGESILVAYSLGNFISAETMEVSKTELLLNIELKTDATTGKLILSKVNYIPIYVLDNGKKAENRYELIDIKKTAQEYANGNKKIVNKKTYNKLLEALKLLEGIIK